MASAPATTIILPAKASRARLLVDQKYRYHPSFSSTAAHVVLSASDDIMYRMHSYTLRTASGFFRDMFTLPQPSPTHQIEFCPQNIDVGRDVFVSTHVSSDILSLFLMLISGIPINTPLHEWDRVLRLAENWDAPGPLSYIRLGLRSTELAKRDPLRLFSIASHFGWEYERNWAAQHSLMIDISSLLDTDTQKTLEGMSSKDLLCLLKLRHRRKEEFRAYLDDPDRFSVGNSDILCSQCHETRIDNGTWRILKELMVAELERRPLGDSIVGYDVDGIGGENSTGGILTWPEAEACFKATCKKGCGSLNYDECATLKQIQSGIDSLPWDL
ncbi:hypothetical protein EV368DRAFT_49217 [Lentinula lateritia]|uniref:Uncharacterized protein n=1 Tax=Lentinula aff. lateritia TaxID=2804960 RepID=A0ACC1U4Q2_9AGAR|nr:hypothetical protein F5876DRAFT_39388 [Lentinula aff. lateritia]KAJ3848473.1 hypothetical protein EV368DRAFT_49217 [Lentinula lateritia]